MPDAGGKVGLEQQLGLLPVRPREQPQRLGVLPRRLVVAGRARLERPYVVREVGRFQEPNLFLAKKEKKKNTGVSRGLAIPTSVSGLT